MEKSNRDKVIEIIAGLAEYYDKTLSRSQMLMYVEDLAHWDAGFLAAAVRKYRREPKNVFFPLPAKLIEVMVAEDGRPGPEEAWAMVPKHEHESIVWTDEIAGAWGVANQIEGDSVAQRMAFREVYQRLVSEARAEGRPAKWTPSLGRDPMFREMALRHAVEKGRITIEYAQQIGPEFGTKKKPGELGVDVKKLLPEMPK